MFLIAAFMLLSPERDPPDEIIVEAKPRRCALLIGGHRVREDDFRRWAVEWAAGRPVRVVVPRAARTRCLAKVIFKLHDRGITHAEFVERPNSDTPNSDASVD